MEITIDQIQAFLSDLQVRPLMLNNRNNRIRYIRLFGRTTQPESGFLYIGYGKNLKKTDFQNRNLNLICIGMPKDKQLGEGTRNMNVLLLPEGTALEETFDKLQELFSRTNPQHMDQIPGTLSLSLAGKGLQNVLDIGQELLSNPIYLLHGEYILVANSSRLAVPDPVCEELHRKGRLSVDWAEELFGTRFLERFRTFVRPKLIHSDRLRFNRILARIPIADNDYACVAVVEYNRSFRPQDYEIIQHLCQPIAQELQEQDSSGSIRKAQKGTLINDLISGTILSSSHLNARLNSMRWKPASGYRIFLIHPASASDTSLTFFRDMLSREFSGAEVFICRESILMLLEEKQESAGDAAAGARLTELCEETNLRGVIGGSISCLMDLQKGFQEVVRVLQIADRMHMTGPCFDSRDFQLFLLMETLHAHVPLEDYIHPVIRSVREYDAEHGSDYEGTLFTYLLTGKDPARTSETLHIHRNTLLYRLTRLSDLFAIDWNDGFLLIQLGLSLEILHFLKQYSG